MFILTRRIGESLKIGPDTTITMTDVNGLQARIGIAAPKDMAVRRGEIVDKLNRECSRAIPVGRTSDRGGIERPSGGT